MTSNTTEKTETEKTETEKTEVPQKINLSNLRDVCRNLYHAAIDRTIQTACDDVEKTVEGRVKSIEAKLLHGESFYNYTVPPIELTLCEDGGHSHEYEDRVNVACPASVPRDLPRVLGYFVELHRQFHQTVSMADVRANVTKFLGMSDGERLILFQKYKEPRRRVVSYLFVTNFARSLRFDPFAHGDTKFSTYRAFDFWIPEDYYEILMRCRSPDPSDVVRVLDYMRATLSDRKFIPTYVRGIIDENRVLRADYTRMTEDMATIRAKWAQFEAENGATLEVLKERAEVEKLRDEVKRDKERLRLVALKLEMDRKKLDEDLRTVDDRLKEINGLDVNSVLNS